MRKACAHDQAAARTAACAHYMGAELVRLGLGRVHGVATHCWCRDLAWQDWCCDMVGFHGNTTHSWSRDKEAAERAKLVS